MSNTVTYVGPVKQFRELATGNLFQQISGGNLYVRANGGGVPDNCGVDLTNGGATVFPIDAQVVVVSQATIDAG